MSLFRRKKTHFVLWRPRHTAPAPRLIIGRFQPGAPPSLADRRDFAFQPSPTSPDLWEVDASACGLADGRVYHYWFEVTDAEPYRNAGARIWCTDPTAYTVDWRLMSPPLPPPYVEDDRDPAGVIKYRAGELIPCDPGGEEVDWAGDAGPDRLPANNRLVIYELPTRWSRTNFEGATEIGVGTFRDATALVDRQAAPANFADVAALQPGAAHLEDLGVNALELLPPADSWVDREWGYATSNYFAPDFNLGSPEGHTWPTAASDLAELVKACHRRGVRFFADVVMAFATRYSYRNVNYPDFHVKANSGDPEEYAGGPRRDGFGGDLFKYNLWVDSYDPLTGRRGNFVPARRLMLAYLVRWMRDFRLDGLRLDSVNNIANWDFVGEYTALARALWRERWAGTGAADDEADGRFLVVGEELAVPLDLLRQGRLDALWNERFKRLVRDAVLGRAAWGESFESTVRKMIDCRELGFADGSQAVNYVTSHDVGGEEGNRRLFNFLNQNGIRETEPRIKLAFACLLTAVGVPMILAGEEFADQHDLEVSDYRKQADPVNYGRLGEPWRRRVFEYVSRLVRLRTTHDALSVNDTSFIHTDFGEGKRVLAWRRGREQSGAQVVVVANFSDWGTPDPRSPSAEYVVNNWPATPAGRRWREVTQARDVPEEWVGREPLYPWEAKVYALV